jgi:hypothetical protein
VNVALSSAARGALRRVWLETLDVHDDDLARLHLAESRRPALTQNQSLALGLHLWSSCSRC